MAMTGAERQARRRAALAKAGMREIPVTVPIDRVDEIRAIARKMAPVKVGPYRGYTGVANFGATVCAYHGRVHGIRDVVTFSAGRAGVVESEFRASVDDYLDFCAADGVEPEQPEGER